MTRLVILGAGGHGRAVADVALENGWSEAVFFDDAWPETRTNGVWPVAGTMAEFLNAVDVQSAVVVAIGDNDRRDELIQELEMKGVTLPTIVHPRAMISEHAVVNRGCVVMAGAIVNYGAQVGVGSILNTGCTVDHDCVLGRAVHISPGVNLAGGVTVGDRVWVGIGACVREGVNIGRRSIIGAGAVVVDDVRDGVCAMGVPARVSRKIR